MRNRVLFLGLASITIAAVSIFSFQNAKSGLERYSPRQSHNAPAMSIHGAMEYVMAMRANPLTGIVDHSDILKARKAVEELDRMPHKSVGLTWDEVGPDNIGGRTRAILIDKDNPSIVFAGGVAGGLWKSTTGGSSWVQVSSITQNLAISSIAQDKFGNIFVGTGESFATASGGANGSSGFIGGGMYFSSDKTTFSLLPSTLPTGNSSSVQWAFINKLACDPNTGRLYAATNRGLKYSDDKGTTWNDLPSPLNLADATDVKIATDGTVVASLGNRCYINNLGTGTFVNYSTGAAGKLPASGVARAEFAIAPSDPNYIYASLANNTGNVLGIYRSTDKGENWTLIGPPNSTSFQPFRNQGTYNNIIAVYPNNKNKVLLGGIDMWVWSQGSNFTRVTQWSLEPSSPLYIHADHHIYVFHPTNPDIIYTGTDGGVSRSLNGGQTFHTLNKKYSTIQFYSISAGPRGEVIGGTQDNGTLMVDGKGNFPTEGFKIQGGDGGWTAMSHLNQRVLISTTYYAGMQVTPDYGKTAFYAEQFFSKRMLNFGTPGESFAASFVTPMLLWESTNDLNSPDSLYHIVKEPVTAGTKVLIRSAINKYPFYYTTPVALNTDDTIRVQDIVQARFFLAGNRNIWMTRQIHEFGKELEWYNLANLPHTNGTVQTIALSKDGNHLFAGTTNGQLYRISNINNAIDSVTGDAGDAGSLNANCVVELTQLNGLSVGSRNVTSIAVDPKNNDRIVVTVGNYGSTTYVYYSTNATSANPTFVSKQGNLPAMPVYTSIIEMNNSNHVIIGTEYGIYATDNIAAASVTWAPEENGMGRVPVYSLRQQLNNLPYLEIVSVIEGETVVDVFPGTNNFGAIYAGTHGRGSFVSKKYLSIERSSITNSVFRPSLHIYPNPVSDIATIKFTVGNPSETTVNIYDMNGRLVIANRAGRFASGSHTLPIDVSSLKMGVYIVQLVSGGQSVSARMVVK